jgi:hypothetical protein
VAKDQLEQILSKLCQKLTKEDKEYQDQCLGRGQEVAIRRKPLSARVVSVLRSKAKNRKNITLGMLKQVYRRGQGAYLSSGSRPRTSMASWSMGRVNSFLRGSRKHDLDLRRKSRKRK